MLGVREGLITVATMGLLAGGLVSPASAAPPPDRATPRAQQSLAKPLKHPKRLPAGVWTAALRGPLKTTSGQRLTVTVVGRNAKGQRVGPDRLRMLQKPKQVQVWARPGTRIKVIVSAPGTTKYRPFRAVYTTRATGPMAAQQTSGFAVGPNAAGSAWSDFFQGLMVAFTDEFFGGTASYVLGALLSSGGKDNQLQPILDELKKIQGQLDDINNSINDLRKDVAFAACQGQTTEAAAAVAVIQTANQRYINLVKSKETNPQVLSRWVEEVLNINSVQTAVNTINNVLTGLGGTTGSLGACGQALQTKWVDPLDEEGYYQRLWNYLGFFYQAEILGMNMLTDANHYKGVEAAKAAKQEIPSPDEMGRFLCDDRYGPKAARSWCGAALQIANIVYYDMIRQAEQAGAAYAWNTYGRGRDKAPDVMAAQKGVPVVWWLDLNSWSPEALKKANCTLPLSSKNPCGPLVGTGELREGETTQGFYSTWNTATSMQWANLLNLKQNGGKPLSKVMETVGLAKGKTDNLIVLSRDRGEVAFPGGNDRRVMMPMDTPWRGNCFMDTSFPTSTGGSYWPTCTPGAVRFYDLADVYSRDGDTYGYTTSDFAKKYATDPGFYQGKFAGRAKGYGQQSFYWPVEGVSRPGWLTTSSGLYGVGQYRWPVLDLTTVTCTPTQIGTEKIAVDGKNKGGAYSMCGNDLYWWLRYNFPLPPRPYE